MALFHSTATLFSGRTVFGPGCSQRTCISGFCGFDAAEQGGGLRHVAFGFVAEDGFAVHQHSHVASFTGTDFGLDAQLCLDCFLQAHGCTAQLQSKETAVDFDGHFVSLVKDIEILTAKTAKGAKKNEIHHGDIETGRQYARTGAVKDRAWIECPETAWQMKHPRDPSAAKSGFRMTGKSVLGTSCFVCSYRTFPGSGRCRSSANNMEWRA